MNALWSYPPKLCPAGPHRGPEGPNEDIAQCGHCGLPTWAKRPAGETFGDHLPDCSLPIDHESYCHGGGSGHPRAAVIRGYSPPVPAVDAGEGVTAGTGTEEV